MTEKLLKHKLCINSSGKAGVPSCFGAGKLPDSAEWLVEDGMLLIRFIWPKGKLPECQIDVQQSQSLILPCTLDMQSTFYTGIEDNSQCPLWCHSEMSR
jgi:hypothetical protein